VHDNGAGGPVPASEDLPVHHQLGNDGVHLGCIHVELRDEGIKGEAEDERSEGGREGSLVIKYYAVYGRRFAPPVLVDPPVVVGRVREEEGAKGLLLDVLLEDLLDVLLGILPWDELPNAEVGEHVVAGLPVTGHERLGGSHDVVAGVLGGAGEYLAVVNLDLLPEVLANNPPPVVTA